MVLVPLAAAACFLGFGARRVMADVRPARMLGSRFVSTYEESYTGAALYLCLADANNTSFRAQLLDRQTLVRARIS